jgi:hypothetical protein
MHGISNIDVESPTIGHIHSQLGVLRSSSLKLRYFILEEFISRGFGVTSIETESISALGWYRTLKLESVQQLVIVGLIERVLETLKIFPPGQRVGVCPHVIADDMVRVRAWARIRRHGFLQDQNQYQGE